MANASTQGKWFCVAVEYRLKTCGYHSQEAADETKQTAALYTCKLTLINIMIGSLLTILSWTKYMTLSGGIKTKGNVKKWDVYTNC